MLEEPPDHVRFLLLAAKPEAVLGETFVPWTLPLLEVLVIVGLATVRAVFTD